MRSALNQQLDTKLFVDLVYMIDEEEENKNGRLSRKAPAKAHLVLGSSPRNGFIASQWRQFRRGRAVISQTILHVLATIPWHEDTTAMGCFETFVSHKLVRFVEVKQVETAGNFIHHLEALAANNNAQTTHIQMTMDFKVIQNTSSSITDSHIPLQRVCDVKISISVTS